VAALGGGDDLHDGEGSTWRTGEPSLVGACSMPSGVTEHCREERTDTLGYDSLGSVMLPLPRLVTTTEDILGGGGGGGMAAVHWCQETVGVCSKAIGGKGGG
jgi:hypothetical protein